MPDENNASKIKENQEIKQDIRTIYQIYIEDIRHTKKQQWLCLYYLLLLQSGIIGFATLINPQGIEIWLLRIVSVCLAILGASLLIWYQGLLLQCRYRIDHYIKAHLLPEEKKALDKPDSEEFSFTRFNDIFIIPFVILNFFSCFFILYFLKFFYISGFERYIICSIGSIEISRLSYYFTKRNYMKQLALHQKYCQEIDNTMRK